MLKNIQIKIILAFSIIGIVVIATLGTLTIYNLENINDEINSNISLQEVEQIVQLQIHEIKIIIVSRRRDYGRNFKFNKWIRKRNKKWIK